MCPFVHGNWLWAKWVISWNKSEYKLLHHYHPLLQTKAMMGTAPHLLREKIILRKWVIILSLSWSHSVIKIKVFKFFHPFHHESQRFAKRLWCSMRIKALHQFKSVFIQLRRQDNVTHTIETFKKHCKTHFSLTYKFTKKRSQVKVTESWRVSPSPATAFFLILS